MVTAVVVAAANNSTKKFIFKKCALLTDRMSKIDIYAST